MKKFIVISVIIGVLGTLNLYSFLFRSYDADVIQRAYILFGLCLVPIILVGTINGIRYARRKNY